MHESTREILASLRAASGRAAGGDTVPKTKARWMASFRWTKGEALTPIDIFNASAGRVDR